MAQAASSWNDWELISCGLSIQDQAGSDQQTDQADSQFQYWQQMDRERLYPSDFVSALTDSGFLSVLIPEQYGGAGL